MNRRKFIGKAASSSMAFSIVAPNVLGGPKYTAPSDKLTLANIGCGTQGLREMPELLKHPDVQIISVCDPNKMSTDYVDWSKNGIVRGIRRTLEDDSWGSNFEGIPGGRDVAKDFVDRYYAKQRAAEKFSGVNSYEDFRELLEKEKDLDAVKIMTPDHLHAVIGVAAMNKGCHVATHKPIANRIDELRKLIDVAKKNKKVSTHLLAWTRRTGYDMAKQWIQDGAIGTLKEIHNWSNRPVWPQWTSNPEDTPKIPDGFNWDLWLGPVPDRPYHPNYTHAVFRGWYDFGSGSIADMGHYSLWPLFQVFGINKPPVAVEAYGTTTSAITESVSHRHRNDVAFPASTNVQFDFAANGDWPAFKLCWYDGGMKPLTPEGLVKDGKSLTSEGMMFVGDKGTIVAGYHCQKPRLIPEKRMSDYMGGKEVPKDTIQSGTETWIDSFRNGEQSPGSFIDAQAVSETILLSPVALRTGKKLEYDSENMKITNVERANKYLKREYRDGWAI